MNSVISFVVERLIALEQADLMLPSAIMSFYDQTGEGGS
jgi:hypothetical protein